MPDTDLRAAIKRSTEPVIIAVPERWLIAKLADGLDAEARKLRGQAKRSGTYTAQSKLALAAEYEQHAAAIRSQQDTALALDLSNKLDSGTERV